MITDNTWMIEELQSTDEDALKDEINRLQEKFKKQIESCIKNGWCQKWGPIFSIFNHNDKTYIYMQATLSKPSYTGDHVTASQVNR